MTKRRKRKDRKTTEAGAGDPPRLSSDAEYAANLVYDYVRHCIAPQRMAAMRRARGDANASPHDYDCRCPVPDADALPDCWPRRPACRFRHRMRPRPKFHRNAFAHNLARELFAELRDRWPRMSEDERIAVALKALAFSEAEKTRAAARLTAPRIEPAPLIKNWKESDVR